jgi:carbon-monoxide dehydrogenase medium subunit
MPLLALRMSTPSLLVDINRIAALQAISTGEGAMRLGAMARQNAIIASAEVARSLPVLVQAASHVGHHQTRNRGTIGGSISLGEPAAELPATAVALGAVIEVRSTRGAREIAAEDFYVGPYSTVLEPDELVIAIRFPDWSSRAIPIFHEVARRPGDFALLGFVGALAVEQGRIVRAGLAWFGMGPVPMKARRAEAALLGQTLRNFDANAAVDLAVADTDPFDDIHATAKYRRDVGRRACVRVLTEALRTRVKA